MHMDSYHPKKPGAYLINPSPPIEEASASRNGGDGGGGCGGSGNMHRFTYDHREPPVREIYFQSMTTEDHDHDPNIGTTTTDGEPLYSHHYEPETTRIQTTTEPLIDTPPSSSDPSLNLDTPPPSNDHPNNNNCKLYKPRNRQCRILMLIFVSIVTIIIIAITVPLVFALKKSNTSSIAKGRYSKIKAIVQTISSSKDLYNSSSPQARALEWIVYNDTLNISETNVSWIRQRYILAVFYYSTGGNTTWLRSFQFLTPTHECTWNSASNGSGLWWGTGLGCNLSNSLIQDMNLGYNNLTGTLPKELSHLAYLQYLSLPHNELGGTIPTTLASLPSLQNLFLASNRFVGTFPNEFQSFRGRVVIISQNTLHGTLPSLSHLSSLTNFDVTQNNLSGPFPQLPTNIILLDLSENNFTGTIPSYLGNCVNATQILLHGNHFYGTLPNMFEHLSKLVFFSVNNNHLTGTIPTTLWSISSLIMLGLGSNNFTGNIQGIEQLSSTQGISLENNKLSGIIPSEIGQLSNLHILSMHRNQFIGTIPKSFGQLKNMMFLSFGDNTLTGTLPDSFAQLTKLDFLSAARTQINDTLAPLCTAYNSSTRYYVADCTNYLQCPPGCCKVCCDNSFFDSVCHNGQIYVDPLIIAYTLYDIKTGNFSW